VDKDVFGLLQLAMVVGVDHHPVGQGQRLRWTLARLHQHHGFNAENKTMVG